MDIAAFRGKYAANCMQIQRIRHQRIERIRRDRDHVATTHGGGGAFNRGFRRTLGVNLDEIGCHRISVAGSPAPRCRICYCGAGAFACVCPKSSCYSRGPIASATSTAI